MDKRHSMKKLEEENFFLKEIIAKIPGHIFWTDKDNKFLGSNDLQAFDAGLSSRDEIIGKTNYDMPWKKQANDLNRINNEVMKTGKTIVAEELSTINNGETLLFHSEKTPLRNKDGKVIGVLGVAVDITERKKMETELQRLKKALEEANKSQLNLLQIINHESRDPMNIILGASQILLKKTKDQFKSVKDCLDYFHYYIQNIYDYGQKLMGIINFVCDFVENELMDEEIIQDELNLSSVMKLLKRKYGEELTEKSVQFHVDIGQDVPEKVITNTRRFLNIIDVILNNAIKYTQKGSVTVRIRTKPIDDNRLQLMIDIEDTGAGIKQEQLKNIFSHFELGQERTYMSSGLMLSVTKQRLKMLDGDIHIESESGQGTKVHIALPVSCAPGLRKIKLFRHPKILVVEDNLIAAEVMQNLLTLLGAKPTVVDNGRKAIECVQKKPKDFDMVLLDIFLPDLFGYQVAEELNKIFSRNHVSVPMLATTAHLTEVDRNKCYDAGIEGIFYKPISLEDLQDIFESYLEEDGVRKA